MKQKFLLLAFVSFFTGINTAYTQQQDTVVNANPYLFNKAYLKSYWFDTRDIALSPLYWKKNQWIGFASVTLVSAFVYIKEEKIQIAFQKNRSPGGDQFSKYILEPWGSGFYPATLMAFFYLDGVLFKNPRSKKMALLGTKTLLISAGFSRIPKYVFQRHRPNQDNPPQPMSWEGPFNGLTEYTSFPSGHAVSSFAMATVIAAEYSDHWFVPLMAYTIAGATSLSRIYDNQHWASDVLIGAAFGYAMGKLIYNKDNWLNGRKAKPLNKNIF